MYFLGSILLTITKILSMVVYIYQFIIIGAIIVSWVNADPYNPIVRFLRQVTEPVFYQVRRILPRAMFRLGLDFTPMIVLIVLMIVENSVFRALHHYAGQLMAS